MSITLANPNEMRRRASSKALILDALTTAGAKGCTNGDLNDISFRYGARILELRQAGHAIESIHEHDGTWRFVLTTGPRPGEPGFLASLPVLASITGRAIPAPATADDTPAPGCLF